MRVPRILVASATVGLITLLSGCVVVPLGSRHHGYHHSSYGAAPVVVEPVVVAPAPRYGRPGYRRGGHDQGYDRDWR